MIILIIIIVIIIILLLFLLFIYSYYSFYYYYYYYVFALCFSHIYIYMFIYCLFFPVARCPVSASPQRKANRIILQGIFFRLIPLEIPWSFCGLDWRLRGSKPPIAGEVRARLFGWGKALLYWGPKSRNTHTHTPCACTPWSLFGVGGDGSPRRCSTANVEIPVEGATTMAHTFKEFSVATGQPSVQVYCTPPPLPLEFSFKPKRRVSGMSGVASIHAEWGCNHGFGGLWEHMVTNPF